MENKSIVPMNYGEMSSLAKIIFKSRMFTSLQSAEQTLLTMMAGREMGMGFIEACNSIYLVNGKVSLLNAKVGQLIKSSGKYDYKVVTHTDTECIIEFFGLSIDGKEWELIGVSPFSILDSKKAGLKGMNWDKYPRNMLFARALTNGAKWFTPDVFGGAIYEPEELGAKVQYNEDGSADSIEIPTPTPIPTTVSKPNTIDLEDDFNVLGEKGMPEEDTGSYQTVDGETELELLVVSNEEDTDRSNNKYQKYVFAEVLTYIDKYGRRQTADAEWSARRDAYTKNISLHQKLQQGDIVKVVLEVNESVWKGRNMKFQNIKNLELSQSVEDDLVEESNDEPDKILEEKGSEDNE